MNSEYDFHLSAMIQRHQSCIFQFPSDNEPSRALSKQNEIPVVEEKELTDFSKFEQLYLIGKIWGETIPLKTIILKSTAAWK